MFPYPSLLEFHEVIRKLTRLPLKLSKVLNHTANTQLRHQLFLMICLRPGPVRKTNHQNNHRDAKKNERHFEFLLPGTLKHSEPPTSSYPFVISNYRAAPFLPPRYSEFQPFGRSQYAHPGHYEL